VAWASQLLHPAPLPAGAPLKPVAARKGARSRHSMGKSKLTRGHEARLHGSLGAVSHIQMAARHVRPPPIMELSSSPSPRVPIIKVRYPVLAAFIYSSALILKNYIKNFMKKLIKNMSR
jgi:hypothetical protein